MSETATNFTGHPNRECGAHRTTGPHRAWCFDCSEWCAPHAPCVRCEMPRMRAQLETADDVIRHLLDHNIRPTTERRWFILGGNPGDDRYEPMTDAAAEMIARLGGPA